MKHDLLRSLDKPVERSELERIRQYEDESATLAISVACEQVQVTMADVKHNIFALGVTLLSIAITLSGMAIVVDRPLLWHVGIVFGVAGNGLIAWEIVRYL
ncbi:MAG: DUF4337 family protein [Candidatus Latescibacterota bacterium]|nr:DUF4337 family protein [Candidatus Latescibacterota bacterium]